MKNLNFLNELNLSHLKAERCKRSFYYFFLEFWETIEAVELINNWHIKFICDELQLSYERWSNRETQDDILINVPPGSSKSTICTQLFPVWLWIKDPSIRVISSSYSDKLSTAHAVKSRDCIGSDKFNLYFYDIFQIKHGEDNKTWYKNSKKGERFATSTGGSVTGIHADFIIVDDPLNVKKSESEAERDQANKHVFETLSSRKTDRKRTVTIVIMQRLHDKDVAGMMLKRKPVNHICLPGELSDITTERAKQYYKDGLLDTNRLDREALNIMRVNLGSYGYAGQIMQKPSPEGGGQLKSAWFKKIGYDDFKVLFQKENSKVIFYADTAYTDKQKNDPTALMATAKISNDLYIINSESIYKEMPELLKYIPNYISAHGYTNKSILKIEPKASGKSVVQMLKRESSINVVELPSPTDDKITRVSSVAPFVESGRCYIVEGGWNDSFIQQCSAFPNGDHDDEVDNLVNAILDFQNIRKGSIKSYVV